jgi:hypothetical protein
VFAVARGDRRVRAIAGRVEMALAAGDLGAAVRSLSAAPGLQFRSVDRLLRASGPDVDAVLAAVEAGADTVSGRVLLGLREHLQNRVDPAPAARAWVTEDTRAPLAPAVVQRVVTVLDDAVRAH